MKRIILLPVITLAIVGILWFNSPVYRASKRIEVDTILTVKRDISDSVIARGVVDEGNSQTIRISTAARIDAVHINIGDKVKKGDILFDVVAANDSEENVLDVAQLIPELKITKEEAISAISQYKGYEEILGNYINEVPRSEEIAMEPQIISPISGVITDVKVKESDITAKSASIATVSDFNTLLVRVSIPEMYIERIKVGQKAEITGQAFKGEKISGTVKEIHPTAKQKSGITGGGETVVDAVIKIDSPDPKLRPGYSVSARICTDMHKDAAVLPYECINEDEKGANSVFIIKDGIAIERPVVTGFELDHELEIKLGLAGKERVIINPPQSLKSGNEVKVRGAG